MQSECFWCKQSVTHVALVDLVYTWEPFKVEDDVFDEELKEVPWHKNCYNNAQQGVQAECEHKHVTSEYRLVSAQTRDDPAEYEWKYTCNDCGERLDEPPDDAEEKEVDRDEFPDPAPGDYD